ncbi:hypothetical protein OPKNFCMD_5273 [Methylobacterium crusticola]|uniref:Response regulatory domain-containing protein n=2 Tax=Methylobacterium crusticola TaxID=1697972 RepID=A0ABQ4R6Y1_9HYPH|nr:hypothetical protein OPKNFCMD_5273 [Methylobacterium crusticola]
MVAVEMLEVAGWTALEAADADEAMLLLERRSDIAVLFTDVDMPGSMDGFELATQVASRWPHIRLVLTSGRLRPSNDDVPDSGQFVAKPYRTSQLLEAFRNAG